jgi:hypothetical protein
MNQNTLLRNEVEVSPKRFLAETSTKGVSAQDLRSKFQPIYQLCPKIESKNRGLRLIRPNIRPIYQVRSGTSSKREEWSGFRATCDQSARRVSSATLHPLRNCSISSSIYQYIVNWHAFRKSKTILGTQADGNSDRSFESLAAPKEAAIKHLYVFSNRS